MKQLYDKEDILTYKTDEIPLGTTIIIKTKWDTFKGKLILNNKDCIAIDYPKNLKGTYISRDGIESIRVLNDFFDFLEIGKQAIDYYYRTRDKFIIIENNYSNSGYTLKMSVVNGEEYAIIGNDLYAIDCIKIISKLYQEYERIICDVSNGLICCMNYELNKQGLYLDLEYLEDKYIKHLLRENSRLSVIGAYVESRELIYNKDLLNL